MPLRVSILFVFSVFPLWAAHPLDPLNASEISAARDILQSAAKLTPTTRFASIALDEPVKADVIRFHTGDDFPRRVFAVLYERATNSTWEAVVNLRTKQVDSWKMIPDAQPAMLKEDYTLAQKIVREDPRWQVAMRKRKIEDFENVQLDLWTTGYFGWPEEKGKRIFRAVAYYKGKDANAYAHPIEGLVATVDLNEMRVLKLTDAGAIPVPKAPANLDEKSVGPLRNDIRSLKIAQPEGVSFAVDGSEIRWQKWRFRYGFNPREGLVLYTVGYEDQGRLRSILYRASLSEMVVPYADPGAAWYFRNAFDEGEYGLGSMTGSLQPLTDAPENAKFFDAEINNDEGSPRKIERAIALYERDGGLLWKHRDESRRARDLVMEWISTIGSYDYGFRWIFHQDGSLEMEVELTGIVAPKGTAPSHELDGRPHATGTLSHPVAQGILAVHHQHFFNFRLDMDVDSAADNSVLEMNTVSAPVGPMNTRGNAFVTREEVLVDESKAQRTLSMESSRCWKIVNPSMKNALGQTVGYVLVPGENALPYADPKSSVRQRAGFLDAQVWVTPYQAEERYAAGDYVNQNPGGEGLVKWTKANRSVENTDVVVWYTLGITHIPRPEDWPVMPVHRAGFQLIPAGFFDKNPALDVPKQ